ncbi:MAG: ComEC/Rec2 family competence protein [Chitinophagales bacterium]
MPIIADWLIFLFFLLFILFNFFLHDFTRYKLSIINGIAVSILVLALGCLLTWHKDIRNNRSWYGKYYKPGDPVQITLQEPLVEKTNSYKAIATVTTIESNGETRRTSGDIIAYFKKDSAIRKLDYGSQIIFSKPLQEIKNAGNPGGFDYKSYCLFHDISYQVYLDPGEFVVLKKNKKSFFGKIILPIREKVISILRADIPGEKEQGLAEAVLIGYKDDLDKNLEQSYTNTGVVHIIVIAGLHLGMIYWVLVLLLKSLKKRKRLKWLYPVIVISGLWLFSLVTGAHATVVRSAVMFTCVVMAESLGRKTSVYNTLALSAFILLCYDPFWLWDAGFQLSYAAVVSIVTFTRPIYNWFYIKNRALDFTWKINAVSISAQLFTMPLSIYHFHQFPDLFLLTNFVAVPLAIVILLGEIALCFISFIKPLAVITGHILSWLIWTMNSYIERIELLPFSIWNNMQITILQAIALTIMVAGFSYWLLEKQKSGVWIGIFSLLVFTSLRSVSFYHSCHQQKLIVYNVPRHQAIDVINGRNYFFIGDSDLIKDDLAKNFHIKPSRVLQRVEQTYQLSNFFFRENFLQYGSKRVLLFDKDLVFDTAVTKIPIDLLILSKDPKLYLLNLCKTFFIKQIVFDGSANTGKLKYWIKDCRSLGIPCYNVTERGAFVMNLN